MEEIPEKNEKIIPVDEELKTLIYLRDQHSHRIQLLRNIIQKEINSELELNSMIQKRCVHHWIREDVFDVQSRRDRYCSKCGMEED